MYHSSFLARLYSLRQLPKVAGTRKIQRQCACGRSELAVQLAKRVRLHSRQIKHFSTIICRSWFDKSALDLASRTFRHTSPWWARKKHSKPLNELFDTLYSLLLGILVKPQDLKAVSMEEGDLIVHTVQFRVVLGTFEGLQVFLNGVDSTPPT
jgi:hypothetical protein